MAIDFFAVASNGYFPTPTPAAAARMSFAGTWGAIGTAPTVASGGYAYALTNWGYGLWKRIRRSRRR